MSRIIALKNEQEIYEDCEVTKQPGLSVGMRKRMRQARLQAGFTQGEIAYWLRRSNKTVGHWENGRQKPSELHIRMWAALCNVSVEWLRTGR